MTQATAPVAGSRAQTAQARYAALETDRSPYLQRAREAAALTIPALLPPQGSGAATKLPQPFQSLGARGVNNLSSKLLLALFPPGSSFFRLVLDDFVLEELVAKAGGVQEGEDARAEFESALAKVERAVCNRLEQKGFRLTAFELFKHLLVVGNCLLHVQPDGSARLHRLTNYVVKRDPSGTPIEIIILESLDRVTVPEKVREILGEDLPDSEYGGDNKNKPVQLYTRICLRDGKYHVTQEVNGQEIDGVDGEYPTDKMPFIPLRFTKVDGEDYGRSFIDEYMGDLLTTESLTASITRFAAVAAKIVVFVAENGETDLDAVAKAESGDVIAGKATDVTMLQLEKMADFRVAKEMYDEKSMNLKQAFLMYSAVQRDAERVTAEEVRYLASELEQSLGGLYSVMGQELQFPLVSISMAQMQKSRKLPPLPKEGLTPQIVTGMDALGRNSDLTKLNELTSGLDQTFGAQTVSQYVSVGNFIERKAVALGISHKGLIRSEADVQKSMQQAQATDMAGKIAPTVAKAAAEQQAAAQPTQPQE